VRAATVNRRIRALAVLFAVLLAITLARAFWLQAVMRSEYAAMAVRQHRETVVVPAPRGTIFDRNGDPLAIGEQAMTVYANPQQISKPRDVTLQVAKALHLQPADVYPLLKDRSKGFVYLARKIDPLVAARLQKLDIPGLGFYPEELRTYPQNRVAAQVLGYAGMDNHGLEGLEHSLDNALAGRPGSQTVVKDPMGRALDVVSMHPETPGKSVRLTLDHQIQANAEAVLADTVRRNEAKSATAIVMDPYTGEILAMAVAPGYNANRFATTRADRRRNRAVTDTYEPGSTFKLVTISAALEDHVVTPQTTFLLPPTIQVADRVIHEAHSRGTERLSVRQIVEYSSNIGTITVAERLGAGRLASWINRWGFGRPTGIDFPGESSGFALPLDQWSGSTIGTVPTDRARDLCHPDPDGARLRGDRQRREARRTPSRRADRRHRRRATEESTRRVAHGGERDALDAARSRRRGNGDRGGDPRVHGRRKDGDRGEDRPGRPLLDLALRRIVRGPRACEQAAARDHGHGRRAARVDLGRNGRGSRVQGDRDLQPATPRDPPGRAAGEAALGVHRAGGVGRLG
jgi:hypothetical protein